MTQPQKFSDSIKEFWSEHAGAVKILFFIGAFVGMTILGAVFLAG